MRPEVIIPILIAFPAGLAFFAALTRSVRAHLRDWKDKISFFFWPYPPSRMLIVQELDGEVNIYYDGDYEEIQSENRTLIKTVDGQQYVTEIPPSESSVSVSMFDAKAPSGYESPFGIGWRWIVAASILIFCIYFALVTAWIPPIEVTSKVIGGVTVEVAEQAPLDPFEALVATTAFFSMLTWFLSNVMRMNDRTIAYAWYHAKGINPPHVAIIPVPGITSTGLLEYLEKLGREIKVVIPSDVSKVIEHAIKELQGKTGSRSLAAIILAKLAIAKTWREALAQVLRERFDMRKAGEAAAMIRLGIQPVTKRMIPVVVLVFIVGIAVGYAVGQVFSFGVAPAATNTTVTSSTLPFHTTTIAPITTHTAPVSPSPATHVTTTPTHTASITPASPPAPPTATSVGGGKP